MIAFLASACGDDASSGITEPLPQPTATPTATMSDLPLVETPLSKYLRFTQLTTEDGLSNDQIRNVIQDDRGLMWFATVDGLDRYDGTSVKVYQHDADDPSSLSHDIARALLVDQSGDLWVGTWNGGLNHYDYEKDAFISYQHDPDDPHSLSNNTVRVVYENGDGTIWVGTSGGLNKLDRDSGQFTRYQHDPDDPNSLSNDIVWTVIKDSSGVLWVGTESGLNRFSPDTETFTHYQHRPGEPLSLSHDAVRSIYEDREGNLWLGTEGGLDMLNPERTQITSYQNEADDPHSLSHNIINSVIEDQAGRLWIGTWGGGLELFDRDTEAFIHYRHSNDDPYSLSSDAIWHIYEGQQGMLLLATEGGVSLLDTSAKPFYHYRANAANPNSLSDNGVNVVYADQDGGAWVGANSGGLNRLNRQTEEFTQYLNDPTDPINIADEPVTAIYEDESGILWIGTRGMGLIKYSPDTEQLTSYRFDSTDPHSLSHDSVVNILEDQTGTLWISTYGGGINAFDRATEQFTRYEHDPADPNSLSANVVLSVLEDQAGVLWVGTNTDGLNKFDRQTGKITHYRHDPSDPNSLSADTVLALYEDQEGIFWVGTSVGLNRFDRENNQVSGHYSTKDGLPNDTICGIVEGEQGELWLCTQNGLSRFDPQTESFRNYSESDGLQSNTFTLFSPPAKSESGELFFGGSNGFNAFYPEEIKDTLTPPPVLISDFLLANQPVPIGSDSVLQKSILESDDLVLSYLDNVFSFEFVALNFRAPEKSGYKYKMEGFDEGWIETDIGRRFATYTNLDPGDYVFRVIASNNDGVWNEEGASIAITITPPWWETTWFRIGLAILVIGLLFGGYRRRVRSLQARSQELEAQRYLLFNNSPVGIALSTIEGQFVTVNQALSNMLGILEEELLQQNVIEFYADPAERNKILAELDESGTVQDFGIQFVRHDGSTFFANVNMSRLVLQDTEVLLAIVEDVTDQITAEQQTAVLEERERLARELHDSVTQTLFSASVLAQATPRMLEKNPAVATQNVDQMALLIRGALAEMRTLLIELRPKEFAERNLAELFSLLAESTRARSGANVLVNVEASDSPPDDVAVALYRIAQEALNNVAKHALASEVAVELICDAEAAKLLVKDDGRGFDPLAIPAGHLGVGIMRERAQKIGADIEIDSEIGVGTQVIVTWAKSQNENEHE